MSVRARVFLAMVAAICWQDGLPETVVQSPLEVADAGTATAQQLVVRFAPGDLPGYTSVVLCRRAGRQRAMFSLVLDSRPATYAEVSVYPDRKAGRGWERIELALGEESLALAEVRIHVDGGPDGYGQSLFVNLAKLAAVRTLAVRSEDRALGCAALSKS